MTRYVLLSLIISALLVGCSNIKTRSEIKKITEKSKMMNEAPKEQEPSVDMGEERGAEAEVLSENRLIPIKKRVYVQPPKVGVIFGAGGAKAMAHSGVLKALLAAKIPIDHIVGIGWGAVVGGLYSQEAKIHDVQWKLYKLKSEDIVGRSLFSSVIEPIEVSKLTDFLKGGFGEKKLSTGQIPFACPSLSLMSGQVSWENRGSYREVISKCIPLPPIFKPYKKRAAAAFTMQETISYLKQQGVELIIYVDVLGKDKSVISSKNSASFAVEVVWLELRRYLKEQIRSGFRPFTGSIEVIEVNTSKYTIIDFESRKSLMALGKRAGTRRAKMIAEKYGF